MKNIIVLTTDEELKIFMSPTRQKIIKIMRIEGKPVTSKYIADELNLSPSSSQHHIKKLLQLGIIEFDHYEIINGIKAKYLKLTDKTVSLGHHIEDDLSTERDALAKKIIWETYNGYQKLISLNKNDIINELNRGNRIADVLTGVVHLTQEEANELFDIINNYISNHDNSYPGSNPYEYAIIAYRANLNDEIER